MKGNKILNIICDYLNRKKRYQLSIKFFTFLSEYDFHYVVFLSEVFSSIGNSLDTIKLIAPLLQKNPHVFCLIYQEACSLLQLKRYDLAGTLARSLVQMIPESFEAWLLLIEIYFYSKKYEAALVTLNITPINIKTPFDNGFAFLQEKLIDPSIITNPKEKGTSDYFQFNIDITTPDFHHTKLNDEYKYIQQDYLEDNKKREEVFNQLPGSKFQGNELKLYSMLVKIEREISWEKLLMLRANLFLLDESSLNSLTNLKGKETLLSQSLKPTSAVLNQKQQSKIEDYDIYDEKDSYTTNEKSQSELKLFPGCDPQYKHHQKALEILNKKKPLDNNDVLNETDEEDSDKEHELPSFLKPEEDYKKAISGQILAKKEDSSIFINPPETLSMEERFIIPVKPIKINKNLENLLNKKLLSPKETEKEPNTHELSIRNINKTAEGVAFENSLDFSKKRLCSKLADGLFSALYDDLNALYEWSQEEYQKQVKFRKKKPNSNEEDEDEEENEGKEEEEEEYIEDLKISGKIWVLRGVLAQRLLRNRFAETAYRKAVEKGFSLFAWKQLLSIYLEIENFKAALVCIAELLDELENQGVENFIFLPKWMEEAILQIISKAGYKGLANLLSELNLDDPSINELIKDAVYWKVEGSASV